MQIALEKYLEDLERRLEPETEERLLKEWIEFLNGGFRGDIFSPRRDRQAPAGFEWPKILINDAIGDFEKMALRELKTCSDVLAAGCGHILNIRANYGTGIMPSLFGAEIFMMDRQADTLPTTVPLAGAPGHMEKLIARGVPDIRSGLGGRVFETTERFLARLKPYPKASRYIRVYHPDLQGPTDVCEMLWGSGLFLALVDTPELVKTLLALITQTYKAFMREWALIVPFSTEYNSHWSFMHKGKIVLRDDSAMNLSPAMFEEFVLPYDRDLLETFSGGVVHFCGRGDHYIESMCSINGVFGIAMSQPQYNDMEVIYRNTVDKGIKLFALNRQAAEDALRRGRDLRGNVHCG